MAPRDGSMSQWLSRWALDSTKLCDLAKLLNLSVLQLPHL